MKKELKIITGLGLAVLSASALTDCSPTKGGNDPTEDANKTSINVFVWNGGYGREWLDNAIARYGELVKDKSFEEGKKGVKINVQATKNNADVFSLAAFENSDNDLFFTESIDYYNFTRAQGGNRFLDLTEVVKEANPYDGGKILEDKFQDFQKDFLNVDGSYFGIPHYPGCYGLSYNAEMFSKKGFYYDANNQIQAIAGTSTLGVGPDGKAGTYDDGLPRTYNEFFNLCDFIKAQDIYPVQWTGQYYPLHLAGLFKTLAGDYDGPEYAKVYSTLEGQLEVAKMENGSPKVTKDSSNKHAVSLETEILENGSVTAGDTYRTPGFYYASEFINRLVNSDGGTSHYFADTSFSDTYSHLDAQNDFVQSDSEFASVDSTTGKKKNFAMIVDGMWWESEARSTFEKMAKRGGEKYSRAQRDMRWMPLPAANEDHLFTNGHTIIDNSNSYTIARAGVSEAKAAVIRDFLKFLYSDEELVSFSKDTGVKKNLKYTVSDADLAEMGPFAKSLSSFMNDSTTIDQSNNGRYFTTNFKTINSSQVQYKAQVAGKSVTAPEAFRADPNLTPEAFFSALYQSHKNS